VQIPREVQANVRLRGDKHEEGACNARNCACVCAQRRHDLEFVDASTRRIFLVYVYVVCG
jgi:hypothetical protein